MSATRNEITGATARDPITDCPHHRCVPVKLTHLQTDTKAA